MDKRRFYEWLGVLFVIRPSVEVKSLDRAVTRRGNSVVEPVVRSEQTGPSRARRVTQILIVFLVGQGLSQGLNLAVGFCLLRWLSVLDYSQYSVAFGFQAMLTMLTDLGFAGTIVALVGSHVSDKKLIGAFISSGRHARNVMMLVLFPIASVVYLRIAHLHHWALGPALALLASIAVFIYWSGIASYYSAPLLINGHLKVYYRNQMFGAILRILACVLLYSTGYLISWTASWISSVAIILVGELNRRSAQAYVDLPAHRDKEATAKMWKYVLPNLPSLIFFALQGQISLFLISFFGGTRNIAEVGALGRLGQLFVLLAGFNSAVIEPYMARLQEAQAVRRYFVLFAAGCMTCACLCLVAFRFPNLILPLLGPHYTDMSGVIGWVVLASSLGYLVGLTWTMSAARRWVYWSTSWLTIGFILGTQLGILLVLRMNNTFNVVIFGVGTAAAHLLSMIVNALVGFKRGPRVQVSAMTAEV